MNFSIHPATIADCPALATVSLAAFTDDPIVGYLAQDVAPNVMYAYHLQQFRRRFEASIWTGLRVFKLVDGETGETVAVSRWQFPQTLSAAQAAERDEFDRAAPAKPEGFNRELDREFSAALIRKHLRHNLAYEEFTKRVG